MSPRGELVAEIVELQRKQLESFEEGTFGGWSPGQTTEHEERGDRLALLVRRLATLDEIIHSSE